MHNCYQCGSACYCHGDIDDCPVETIEYAYKHCEGCGCSEDEEFVDYDYFDPDPQPGMDDDPGMVDPRIEAGGLRKAWGEP